MSGKRKRRREDGTLRPTIARRRARINKVRKRAARHEWLAQFEAGARDRFFKHVVLDQAVFLAAFARETGLERADAAELLERTANERRWRKLRTRDRTVVGIAPPVCGVRGCREPAGETVASGEVDGVGYNLRICDSHGEMLTRGALAGISIGAQEAEVKMLPASPEVCAVCGDPVAPADRVVIEATGAVVHRSDDGDGCDGRYWDPPGEAHLTEESW